jgi:hypothetical protein
LLKTYFHIIEFYAYKILDESIITCDMYIVY